jgi:1-acyl-sn-glycerol-3-phosphate acyltransferase
VFPDNKKRLSYTFYSGSPGLMRVKILPYVETAGRTAVTDRREIREEIRDLIYNELLEFEKKDKMN